MTPIEFLAARYDEEADAAARDDDSAHRPGCARLDREFGWECDCGRPAYVLADIAAKRAILALTLRWADAGPPSTTLGRAFRNAASDAVEELLQPFADHPDYDPKWVA